MGQGSEVGMAEGATDEGLRRARGDLEGSEEAQSPHSLADDDFMNCVSQECLSRSPAVSGDDVGDS